MYSRSSKEKTDREELEKSSKKLTFSERTSKDMLPVFIQVPRESSGMLMAHFASISLKKMSMNIRKGLKDKCSMH